MHPAAAVAVKDFTEPIGTGEPFPPCTEEPWVDATNIQELVGWLRTREKDLTASHDRNEEKRIVLDFARIELQDQIDDCDEEVCGGQTPQGLRPQGVLGQTHGDRRGG